MELYTFKIFQRDELIYESLVSAANQDEALEKIEYTFTYAIPGYYDGDPLHEGDIVAIDNRTYVLLPFGWVDVSPKSSECLS